MIRLGFTEAERRRLASAWMADSGGAPGTERDEARRRPADLCPLAGGLRQTVMTTFPFARMVSR